MSNSSISTTQLNQLLQSANSPIIVDVRKNLRSMGYEAVFLEGGIDARKKASLPHTKSSE